MSRRRLMMQQGNELPSWYVRCKYLESSGKQWIDTNLLGGLDTFGIEFKLKGNPNSKYYILGNFNQLGQCGILNSTSDTANIWLRYYIGEVPYYIILGDVLSDIIVSNKNYKIIANGNEKGTMPFDTRKLKNSKLLLFGTGTGSPFNGMGKAYYLKIYDNLSFEKIIRNFIPSLDQTGRPCMYDTVTKKPFYNSGTGEFGYELMDGTYIAPI